MYRDVDIDEISDGKRYCLNDLVKVGCRDCEGCSDCCRDMDRSIIMDPYDIYLMTTGLKITFDELLGGERPKIELNMADGILLPNIKMQKDTNACGFLNDEGRCGIHPYRTGFCRMFPLGRVYEDGTFSYFLQVNECDFPNKSKVKIKKWLGIESLVRYENFVLKWHDLLAMVREKMAGINDQSKATNFMVDFLKTFYKEPYLEDESFYDQINRRIEMFMDAYMG